jgi:hypothetical protein
MSIMGKVVKFSSELPRLEEVEKLRSAEEQKGRSSEHKHIMI